MESHYIFDNTMMQPGMNEQPHSPPNPYSLNQGYNCVNGYPQQSNMHYSPPTTSYSPEMNSNANVVSPSPYTPSPPQMSPPPPPPPQQAYGAHDNMMYQPDLSHSRNSTSTKNGDGSGGVDVTYNNGRYGSVKQGGNIPTNGRSSGHHAKPFNSSVEDFKSYKDVTREHSANLRALALLDTSVKGDGYIHRTTSSKPASKAAHARQVRQEAIKRYYGMHPTGPSNPATTRHVPTTTQRHTQRRMPARMAESSRQVKSHRPGYDPNLDGDKCQLDLERQRFAEQKALKLLNGSFF